MKKILFPTDFSEVSKNAFLYALRLARNLDAEIITLHVYDVPQVNLTDIPVQLFEIYEITEWSQFENYKHHIPVLRAIAIKHHLEHVKISNVLVQGDLIANITKITKDEQIDFIVMGTKGTTSLASTFLGSITTKVMNETKAIVLAIPENCKYKPIKKIVFTTRYRVEDLDLLYRLISLAKVFHSHIDCLYVKMDENKNTQSIVESWRKLLQNDSIDFHTIESSDVEGIILQFIKLHKINMLAMHIHHRGFFERVFYTSLSKKLAFHSEIPVLALH